MSDVLLHESRTTLAELLERAAAGDRVTVVREDGAAFEFDARAVDVGEAEQKQLSARLAELDRIAAGRVIPKSTAWDSVDAVRWARGWTDEEIVAARRDEGRG